MIPVLILAAGQSSRMRGTDKLMCDVHGVPLLRRQIDMAEGIGPIYVALPPNNPARIAALDGTTAIPLIVSESSEGMGGTMRGAVAQLPECAAFMIILGDLISLNTNDLRDVLDSMTAHPKNVIWRGASSDGQPGHPIIFDSSLRPAFADLHGDNGGESIVKPLASRTYLHRFNDNRARHDLDTPEDWSAWRAASDRHSP
ncbi:MAG: nucleotidyltransferase family protein [Yoonia sp.]|nr:nucleotidyltransferase family protein [Yoonia sp.]